MKIRKKGKQLAGREQSHFDLAIMKGNGFEFKIRFICSRGQERAHSSNPSSQGTARPQKEKRSDMEGGEQSTLNQAAYLMLFCLCNGWPSAIETPDGGRRCTAHRGLRPSVHHSRHLAYRILVFGCGAVPGVDRESDFLFVGSPSAFNKSTSSITAGTSIPISAKRFACFPAA